MRIRPRYLTRYRQIAEVLARHGFGAVVAQLGLDQTLDLRRRFSREPEQPISRKTAAIHMREALEDLARRLSSWARSPAPDRSSFRPSTSTSCPTCTTTCHRRRGSRSSRSSNWSLEGLSPSSSWLSTPHRSHPHPWGRSTRHCYWIGPKSSSRCSVPTSSRSSRPTWPSCRIWRAWRMNACPGRRCTTRLGLRRNFPTRCAASSTIAARVATPTAFVRTSPRRRHSTRQRSTGSSQRAA